jgi:hypothetical protein
MLVGRVRPNPDASPRRPEETTNEHLLRTGVLYDLVPVADLVAGIPVEQPVPAAIVVEMLSPAGDDNLRVLARMWVDEHGRVQVDDEREEQFVRSFRVPDDLRRRPWKLIDAGAGLPFLYAFAEWFAIRPNPYSPVRIVVDGRPVRLMAGRPPKLLPRVEPRRPDAQGRLFD